MPERLRGADLGVLSILMAVLTTLLFYRFGVDNHVSELPLVLRAIDPDFLPLDFYTNAASQPGPRTLYARLLALLATRDTLPAAIFGLTLLCNAGVAGASALLARDLFRGSNRAGALAAALVMSLLTFRLGFAPSLYVSELVASRLAGVPLLFALWAGLRGRPLLAAALAGPAALLHPTLGLEGGAIALALAAVVGGTRSPWAWLAALVLLAACAALTAAVSLPEGAIDASRFVALESDFRHPHHGFPGALTGPDVPRGGVFFLGTAGAWLLWLRVERPAPRLALATGLLAVGLAIACVAAAAWIDAFPTRLGALARPLRLLLFLQWTGLLLLGGLAARQLPVALRGPGDRRAALGTLVLVALTLGLGTRPGARGLLCLGLYAGAAAWLSRSGRPTASRAALLALAAALLLLRGSPADAWPAGLRAALQRPRSFEELRGPAVEVARWARAHTPPSAVFLAPPDLGVFRLVAERALVVDWKAFPFQERAMLEWQQRLLDCYGTSRGRGWAALVELDRRYRERGPEAAGCDYGATHAVLYAETPTSRPVLFANGAYRVVALESGESAASGSSR